MWWSSLCDLMPLRKPTHYTRLTNVFLSDYTACLINVYMMPVRRKFEQFRTVSVVSGSPGSVIT